MLNIKPKDIPVCAMVCFSDGLKQIHHTYDVGFGFLDTAIIITLIFYFHILSSLNVKLKDYN